MPRCCGAWSTIASSSGSCSPARAEALPPAPARGRSGLGRPWSAHDRLDHVTGFEGRNGHSISASPGWAAIITFSNWNASPSSGRSLSAYRLVRSWFVPVEELDDPEAAFVDVEVDVPLLEVRGVRLPGDRLGEPPLNCEPGLKAQTAAMLADL